MNCCRQACEIMCGGRYKHTITIKNMVFVVVQNFKIIFNIVGIFISEDYEQQWIIELYNY